LKIAELSRLYLPERVAFGIKLGYSRKLPLFAYFAILGKIGGKVETTPIGGTAFTVNALGPSSSQGGVDVTTSQKIN
jgi:hypothetical protein